MKHTVAFFANGLGDCLLALPSLRALTQLLPTRLTLVTGGCPAELLFGDAGFSQILNVPMSRVGLSTARQFDAAEVLRQLGDADYFISFVPWTSEALRHVVERSNFDATFGFGAGFDFGLWPDPDKHAADRTFDLIRKFKVGLDIADFAYRINLPEEIVAAAGRVRRAIGNDRKILVVHEETSTADKCWEPARMKQMLETITAERHDLTPVVISRRGPSFDISGLEDRIVSIEKVSLGFFLALIADADIFVGVDSVGFHAADLWRVPAVGLFGPTRPEEWGARFSPSCRHVYGDGRMDNISVDAVLDAVRTVLS